MCRKNFARSEYVACGELVLPSALVQVSEDVLTPEQKATLPIVDSCKPLFVVMKVCARGVPRGDPWEGCAACVHLGRGSCQRTPRVTVPAVVAADLRATLTKPSPLPAPLPAHHRASAQGHYWEDLRGKRTRAGKCNCRQHLPQAGGGVGSWGVAQHLPSCTRHP
jgi:hypothetical protein